MKAPHMLLLLMAFAGSSMMMIANNLINEFNHPSILSFEDGVKPAVAISETSRLLTTREHYKHGKSSMRWLWSANHSEWVINQPIPYAPFNDEYRDNSVSTFVFWVYAPVPFQQGKLVFEFLKDGQVCTWFDYNLNFRGWSGAWVAFDRDMQGKPQVGMNQLKVRIEGVEKGELLFDHIMLSSFQDVRQHTADFQAPFINFGTTNHWLTLLDSWNKACDLPLVNGVSNEEFAGVKLLEERFLSILSENGPTLPVERLVRSFLQYQIRPNSDGSVTGLPLFFERYGETYERLGAPRYNLIYANAMGLSRTNQLMLQMAISYHKSTNAADRKTISEMYVLLMRHMMNQGFRAGSAMGTLHHLGYSMRHYYSAALLMREVLRNAGLSEDVQKAMEWFAGTGEIKHAPKVSGMDIDAFNTTLSGRLSSILMMEDGPQKVLYLRAFKRWVDNGLLHADGTLGSFKKDGSIFHHRHNYPAYAVGGLDGAVNAAWILSRTPFALSQEGHHNLKDALLSMRYYSNLLTWPLSLSGRHPDGTGQIYPRHFSRLAIAGSPDGSTEIDPDLAAAYLRLQQNTEDEMVKYFLKEGFVAELDPSGNRVFSYSSLTVHRRNNWMATAMGHSRYLWATESYIGANHYGRYINHGHLQLLTSGNPISNFGSGFRQEGWDWNHFPGTTAAVLPIQELKADIKNLDNVSGYEEMLLSDESFAGGVSLLNEDGIYAMKLHEHDKYNGSLRARKSYFFFGNRIIALGSNVESKLPGSEVHTTLFQVYQSDSTEHPQINKMPIKAFPFKERYQQKMLELSDGYGNYFFVKNANVGLSISMQHSFHEETDEPTKNPFALAYINHGVMPQNNSYEYMVLVQPDEKELKAERKNMQNVKTGSYTVIQHDTYAHIVHDNTTNTTAWVLFEPYLALHNSSLRLHEKKPYSMIRRVDTPSLVMCRQMDAASVVLSIADPDLRFYDGSADEQYDEHGKRIERSVYSREWINNPSKASLLSIELVGKWNLAENNFARITNQSNELTTIEVQTQHGFSRELVLSR